MFTSLPYASIWKQEWKWAFGGESLAWLGNGNCIKESEVAVSSTLLQYEDQRVSVDLETMVILMPH